MASRNPRKECDSWIRSSGLLARLFSAGVVGPRDIQWIITDVELGLEETEEGSRDMVKTCQEVVTGQYVLDAGHVIVKEAEFPTTSWRAQLNAETWSRWTAKVGKLVMTAPDDAEWGLKADAAKAHRKMIEL